MLSLKAKRNVDSPDLYKARLMCVLSRVSYRLDIVSSNVSAATVREASMASVANFALCSKTSVFICSNWVSYLIRKMAAATTRGMEEDTDTMVNFQPK